TRLCCTLVCESVFKLINRYVQRTDDFLVELDVAEFDNVKCKANELNVNIEDVVLDIFTCGFADYFED
ncbi:unnamed protein product, partial [marine sediment metagenome]